MRLSSYINNHKCLEWGITLNQGALFDLINQLHSWAEPIYIEGKVYYWASRNMICDELPLAYQKADTVYRALKILEEKGLIDYVKFDNKDCISITEKGKEWNSEINPSVGNKSEETRKQIRKSSEINPTYKNTNINTTNDQYITPISPKKNQSQKFNPKDYLSDLNIDDQIINDFIDHRKSKRATLTKTVIDGYEREAEKAGISLEEAISISILQGWTGFNHSWLKDRNNSAVTNEFGRKLNKQELLEASNQAVADEYLKRRGLL